MKIRISILTALGVCGLWLAAPSTFAQGSLTPPGAPAPTMKSLDQIEPRTPISSLPFTISQAGSYYLTKNLTGAASQDGITIAADNVTLDLMGFSLNGVTNSGNGVASSGARKNLTICNGVLQGWGASGLSINSTNGSGCILQRLIAGNNIANGLVCIIPGTIFKQCNASSNRLDGIDGGDGCLMVECTTYANVGTGFHGTDGSIFRDCVSRFNGNNPGGIGGGGISAGNNSTINGCTVSANGLVATAHSAAINVGNSCNVTHTTSSGNAGTGLNAGSGNTISECTVSDNTFSYGINVINGNTLIGNTVRNNYSSGIDLGASNLVKNNTLDFNAAAGPPEAGIFVGDAANYIIENSIIPRNIGISFYAKNTVVIHNNIAIATQTFNFLTSPQYVGQTIKTNDLSGGLFINNTANPWANFELH